MKKLGTSKPKLEVAPPAAGRATGVWPPPEAPDAEDPVALARSAPDGTRLPGTLVVTGASPFVALPVGALVALVVVFFGLGRPGRRRPSRVGTEAPKRPPAGPDAG